MQLEEHGPMPPTCVIRPIVRWSVRVLSSWLLVTAAGAAAGAEPSNRALLIGASHYPTSRRAGSSKAAERRRSDQGAAASGRFATFDEAHITVLAGWPTAATVGPPENIERDSALAETSELRSIVVLMAGMAVSNPPTKIATTRARWPR